MAGRAFALALVVGMGAQGPSWSWVGRRRRLPWILGTPTAQVVEGQTTRAEVAP